MKNYYYYYFYVLVFSRKQIIIHTLHIIQRQNSCSLLIFQLRILIRSQKVLFTLCSNPSPSGGVIVQSVGVGWRGVLQLSSATRNYPGPSSEKVSLRRQVYYFTKTGNKTVFRQISESHIKKVESSTLTLSKVSPILFYSFKNGLMNLITNITNKFWKIGLGK